MQDHLEIDYNGRRDLSPAHVRAIVDTIHRQHDAHVRDWEDHVLSGPYADMLLVTDRRMPMWQVIASPGFVNREYSAKDYAWRPLTSTEMWLSELGDADRARRMAEEDAAYRRFVSRRSV